MSELDPSRHLKAVSVEELRRYLTSSGFASEGPWGKFLERFHLRRGRDQYDVLVPVTRDIADYEDRVRDALRDVSNATGVAPLDALNKIIVSNHRVLRLRAHPSSEISSIPFDEGHALLENAKTLVKSSAVSAFSSKHRKVIRGRSPAGVEEYMERLRLGQSEIGSYVFNILLPSDEGIFEDAPGASDRVDTVLTTLESSIELAADMSITKRVPASDRLEEIGLSANFCEALYNIVDWSSNVALEVDRPYAPALPRSFVFDRTSLSVLERTAIKLAPEEQRLPRTIYGTITRLSEPASRRRGSIDLLVRLDSRQRSVRVNFETTERDTIITAFKEKASRMLTVSGFLRTERNGHLVLEEPYDFDISRRGSLL
jgi:hypothetical protein